MLDPAGKDAAGIPLPARALIVVGPDKKVKLMSRPSAHLLSTSLRGRVEGAEMNGQHPRVVEE